jgi:SAM-dependent methyltransferase
MLKSYVIGPHNAHYVGAYTGSAIAWRKIGAIDKVDHIERLLGGTEAGQVLEVGCGTGSVLAQLKERGIGSSHVGIDVADPKKHEDPEASTLDLRMYDGNSIPFPDGSFDLVIASHVIEHVPNPRHLLKEMARVSKKWLFIEVPCEMKLTMSQASIQSALDIGHINAYSPEHFVVLLQTSGLNIERVQVFDHSRDVHAFGSPPYKWLPKMLLRRFALKAAPAFATRLFCYHCAALVSKLADH